MTKIFTIVFFILSILNIGFFVFWWSLIKVDFYNPDGISEYLISNIPLQISILEAVVAFVGVFLVVAGIVGYQNIRDATVEAAKKEALKQALEQTQLYLKTQEGKDIDKQLPLQGRKNWETNAVKSKDRETGDD